MTAEDVAHASLTGLRLGETVRVPGLADQPATRYRQQQPTPAA
jgi:hypothetical protein